MISPFDPLFDALCQIIDAEPVTIQSCSCEYIGEDFVKINYYSKLYDPEYFRMEHYQYDFDQLSINLYVISEEEFLIKKKQFERKKKLNILL